MNEHGPRGHSGASRESAPLSALSQPTDLSARRPPPHRDLCEGRAALVVSEKDSPLQKRQHPELPHKVSGWGLRGSCRAWAVSPRPLGPLWLA